MSGSGDLVEVRILSLPIPVLQVAREHFDGLLREFTLIEVGEGDAPGVPARLVALGEELRGRFSGFTASTDEELAEAEAGGAERVDLVYQLPPDAAEASERLGTLLDEADDHCRSGELLTLVTPPEALAFRRWFLGEFARQIGGQAPRSWPEWRASTA